jgi:AraC-like DNA-binding protein
LFGNRAQPCAVEHRHAPVPPLHEAVFSEVAMDVTDVTSALGFTHLGRFAIAYREVFGEPPSQTLRRRRRGPAAASKARD